MGCGSTFGVKAGEHVERVIGEKAAVVQGIAQHLCHRGGRHFFSHVVFVHLPELGFVVQKWGSLVMHIDKSWGTAYGL